MEIYTNLKDSINLKTLWEKKESYQLEPNEDFFRTAILYMANISIDSAKKWASIAQRYVPDSRRINDLNFVFSQTCEDSLRVLSNFFQYYNTLDSKEEKRFRISFIQTLNRLSQVAEEKLFSWSKQKSDKIPLQLKYDIYNHVDLWKYFPMFHFDSCIITKENLEPILLSFASSARINYADILLSTFLKDSIWLSSWPLLCELKGDLLFSKMNYLEALNYYQKGLLCTDGKRDRDIFEDLLVKAYCCLFEISRVSGVSQVMKYIRSLDAMYIPNFTIKFTTHGPLLLDLAGTPFKSPFSDGVLGFVVCINGGIQGKRDETLLGFALSLSLNKNGKLLNSIQLINYWNDLKVIDELSKLNIPYLNNLRRLVSHFESEYFGTDFNLFAETTPNFNGTWPPENVFNYLDLSKTQAIGISRGIKLMPEEAFATLFRDKVYLGLSIQSTDYVMGTSKAEKEELMNAKKTFYKRFSIKNDVYFKRLSATESESLSNILWKKWDSHNSLSFKEFKKAIEEYCIKSPDQITFYYWLSQIEIAFGNYCKGKEYIDKVVSVDPTWEMAVKLQKFCNMRCQ